MSYGSSIPGPSGQAVDEAVQRQLQSLLQDLSWSYIALWSFNNQSRSLLWTGGHYRGDATRHGDTEVWNEHLFNSMYKPCTFTPGQGSVGMAYVGRRNIWLNGASVHRSAGSKEQAQFLQHARIETALCIPWAESVLELGTCESVAEDVDLMANICSFMWYNILPALGHAGFSQAPPDVSQSPLAATSMMQSPPVPLLRGPTRHQSDNFLSQNFELNSLNEQIRRTSSLNTDMFLQQPEGEGKQELDTSIVPREPRWRSPTTKPADILQTRIPALLATNQALMSARFQYRSHSPSIGTTSSSLSSYDDSSARLSVDSPEQQSISLMASSQHRSSHSYASSSARRETPSHSPEIQLGDTTTTTGMAAAPQHLHGIQQAFGHMLDEGEPLDKQEQWSHMYIDPSLLYSGAMQNVNLFHAHEEPQLQASSSELQDQQPAFKEWRRADVLAPVLQRRERSTNHWLLRCLEMLRRIPTLQQRNQAAVQNFGLQGLRLKSSSSPETLPSEHDPSDQAGPSRGGRRIRGVSRIGTTGPVNAEQEEAAKIHMLSERHRRLKQKENFTALRKLVPIISKNDKASILGDAIIYIKDLQERIQELEAGRTETESQYENLKLSHQELEERNKQLEDAAGSSGAGPVLQP